MYRYINDQTLRMANLGMTRDEIAANFKLPDSLEKQWSSRGYYGSVSHDVKATYVFYLGWFDGNPATSTSCRQNRRRRSSWNIWAAPMPSCRKPKPTTSRGTTAGWPR